MEELLVALCRSRRYKLLHISLNNLITADTAKREQTNLSLASCQV